MPAQLSAAETPSDQDISDLSNGPSGIRRRMTCPGCRLAPLDAPHWIHDGLRLRKRGKQEDREERILRDQDTCNTSDSDLQADSLRSIFPP
jgi:hypothetical protein